MFLEAGLLVTPVISFSNSIFTNYICNMKSNLFWNIARKNSKCFVSLPPPCINTNILPIFQWVTIYNKTKNYHGNLISMTYGRTFSLFMRLTSLNNDNDGFNFSRKYVFISWGEFDLSRWDPRYKKKQKQKQKHQFQCFLSPLSIRSFPVNVPIWYLLKIFGIPVFSGGII